MGFNLQATAQLPIPGPSYSHWEDLTPPYAARRAPKALSTGRPVPPEAELSGGGQSYSHSMVPGGLDVMS